MNPHLAFVLLLSLITLTACSSSPFKQEGINRSITPAMAISGTDYLQKKALWGGLIIETRNKQDHTEIEVLSYPLDSDGEPVRSATAQNRFLIIQSGYLEPAEYAAGHWISVLGEIRPTQSGQVGSTSYQYAVIQSHQLHIWSDSSNNDGGSRMRFGIGIGIHL